MPKGKQFNAAEKHFIEKEVKYQKQIQKHREFISQLEKNMSDLNAEKQRLLDENTQLKDWIERLLQYTELSLNDIKTVCEQDKKSGEAISSLMKLTNMFGQYMRL